MWFTHPRMQNCTLKPESAALGDRRDGSATDLVSAALHRGKEGVRLILANLPGVSYKSAPRRFRETRSTILDW